MEHEKLTRREFLKAGGIATLTTVAAVYGGSSLGERSRRLRATDPHFNVEFDKEIGITFEQASELSLRFDKMYDKFGDEPEIDASPNELSKLAFEILPQFQYEGATNQIKVPSQLAFMAFLNGRAHNHVGGRSDCINYAVLNARYINDWSKMNNRPSWVSTAVHELAHMQQGELCANLDDRPNLENTAQIVTWEIMAAQVNSGNEKFMLPLIEQLRGVAINTAWSISMREGKEKEFDKLRKKLSGGEIKEAAFERTKRVWKGKESDLRQILTTYSEDPLNRVINAVKNNGSVIKDLALPVRSFKVDDLSAFLLRAEELVDEQTKHG